jgi:adenylate cyclase
LVCELNLNHRAGSRLTELWFRWSADELDQILRAFDRMQHGRAQVVSVVGEAGMGKSRLIAEFLDHVARNGRFAFVTVRRAACSSLGEPTYGILGALFRDAYQVEAGDSLEVARQKLLEGLRTLGARAEVAETIAPMLSYVLGVEDLRPQDFEPKQLKRQIALAARTLIEERLNRGPLLIIIEDLHWADAASQTLLHDIFDQLADRPLMVLFSLRPDIPSPLFNRASQSIIRLAPLSPDETRTLVGNVVGPVDEDAFVQIQNLVVTRAGGNPLFAEEIVRGLMSSEVLVYENDRWICSVTPEAMSVPATLQGLLLSRVDRLATGDRRLLQEAAVLGMEFDTSLLVAIATDTAAAEATLNRIAEANLIQPAGQTQGRYRFTHALVHEIVYQNLLMSRRTQLHERVGVALEQATAPRPTRLSDVEALGHHWSLSPHKAKGARYLVAAGDWARGVYANDDAIHHYERAMRTLADCKDCDAELQMVRERLADVLVCTGRLAEALAHYEAVRQTTEATDCVGAARMDRKIGGLHLEAGDRARASACFASGLKRLGADGNSVERAQLFQEMGRLAFRAGDNISAIAWAEKAFAETAGDEGHTMNGEPAREAAATRVQACNTLSIALARTGRVREAVDQIEHSIRLAEAHDLSQGACRGYANLGVLYSSLNPRRSIDTCLRGLQTAKKIGDLAFQSRLYANLAAAYCALTDRCEAEGIEAAQTAIDLDRRLGLFDHLAVPLIVLGQIHQCQGNHARAFALFEEALGLAEKVGEPQLLFPCYDGLATLHLDTGNEELAEVYLAKSKHLCERAGLDPDSLMVLPFLS